MPVVVIGLNHRSAPVEQRERFAIPDASLPEMTVRLCKLEGVTEAVVLSTCNRVEIYAAGNADSRSILSQLHRFLMEGKNPADEGILYQHDEPQSIEHLFKVASGLDSMVLGETEILGQLKKSYETSLLHKLTGPQLNKAFQRAFNVAKFIRSETQIQRGATSVAAVAVELAEKIFDTLSDRQVMVIGAGETSEKTARALLSRGAKSVIVSNRSYDRAAALATELGGRAVHFHDWEKEFGLVDIVISSTAAPHPILDRARLEPMQHLRHHRPLLLIDIAVPRDIHPEVVQLDDVYLYNIDDLQSVADDYLRKRQEEIVICEKIIRERAASLLTSSQRPSSSDMALGHS